MTLTQLGYALAVDRYRNFGQAAKACFVTQPTLSMQLQKLEAELGVVLFDRSRKPVVPTPEGEVLLPQFRAVLRQRDRVTELVDELQGVVAGSYRLAVIPSMATTVLPRVLGDFVASHPRVELHVEELVTAEIVQRLVDETLDGAIVATPLLDPRLTEYPLAREELVVYHADDASLALDSDGAVRLDATPLDHLLVMRQGHCLRNQTLDLCAMGQTAMRSQPLVMEATSLATLCRIVHLGPYFTVLPGLVAADLAAAGETDRIKPIAGEVPYRQIGLVVRRTERRRAVREALATAAARALPALATPGRTPRPRPVPPGRSGR